MAEPMGEKPVMALAGIGEVLGKRLEEKGFDKVNRLNHAVKKKKEIHVSGPHGRGNPSFCIDLSSFLSFVSRPTLCSGSFSC